MPLYLSSTSFQDEGDKLEEFWNSADRKNKWPEAKVINRIKSSEYGVILIDFKNKNLLSSNGYCSPTRLIISVSEYSLEEPISNLLTLNDLNRITALYKGSIDIPKNEIVRENKEKCLEWLKSLLIKKKNNTLTGADISEAKYPYCESGIEGYKYSLISAIFSPPYKVTEDLGHMGWAAVRKWVEDNGWQSKINKRGRLQ